MIQTLKARYFYLAYYFIFVRYLPMYWYWLIVVTFKQNKISKLMGDEWAGNDYRATLPLNFKQWLFKIIRKEKPFEYISFEIWEKHINKKYYDIEDYIESVQKKHEFLQVKNKEKIKKLELKKQRKFKKQRKSLIPSPERKILRRKR